ncbi:chlororespiratory reduction 3 [Wolffia australiana]
MATTSRLLPPTNRGFFLGLRYTTSSPRVSLSSRRRIAASAANEEFENDASVSAREASTASSSSRKKQRRRNEGAMRKSPSAMDVQRLISVTDEDPAGSWSDNESGKSPVLDFWASTPIGQEESSLEKKLREIGEWLVDNTESKSSIGEGILVTVVLYILPVWVLLLLLASGAITLPFEVPFLEDLLS